LDGVGVSVKVFQGHTDVFDDGAAVKLGVAGDAGAVHCLLDVKSEGATGAAHAAIDDLPDGKTASVA
jgi:hypothetical protein